MFREQHLSVRPVTLPLPMFDQAGSEAEGVNPLSLVLKAFSISLSYSLCQRLLAGESFEAAEIDGRIAAGALPIFDMARNILAAAGAIDLEGHETRLSKTFEIPSTEALLSTLLQRFPAANRELRLAAQAMSLAEPFLRTGEFPGARWRLRRRPLEPIGYFVSTAGHRFADHRDLVLRRRQACPSAGHRRLEQRSLRGSGAERSDRQRPRHSRCRECRKRRRKAALAGRRQPVRHAAFRRRREVDPASLRCAGRFRHAAVTLRWSQSGGAERRDQSSVGRCADPADAPRGRSASLLPARCSDAFDLAGSETGMVQRRFRPPSTTCATRGPVPSKSADHTMAF